MIKVNVRRASEADLDILAELNQTVQTLHASLYPDDFKGSVDPSAARAFFHARLGAIVIAAIDDAPVSYLWFEEQPRPETPFAPARPRLFIHHVAVAPDARRKGVGAALMAYVAQRALARGVREIALEAWAANREAQQFFGAQGFAPVKVSLRKRLIAE
ncbi:MAG TPA: GNAT family N-acetyltransferase [Roseiarcus sp.]|nr:GNAT family N-acetyltransferase [Roseiarcus sp.]